jgi:hypothetical protein
MAEIAELGSAQAPSQGSAGALSYHHSAQSQRSSNKISASLPPSPVTTPSAHLIDPARSPEQQHPGPAVDWLGGLVEQPPLTPKSPPQEPASGEEPAEEVRPKPKCPPLEFVVPSTRLAPSQVTANSSIQQSQHCQLLADALAALQQQPEWTANLFHDLQLAPAARPPATAAPANDWTAAILDDLGPRELAEVPTAALPTAAAAGAAPPLVRTRAASAPPAAEPAYRSFPAACFINWSARFGIATY